VSAPDAYVGLAMQLTARSVEGLEGGEARARMLAHIEWTAGQVAGTKAFVEQFTGGRLRLVVLPEYMFSSFPTRTPPAVYAERVAWAMDGPEYEALGVAAQRLGLFIAGNAYERDPHFPGLFFQTCFVIDPAGSVALRYRRLNSMYAVTPHDVWSRYLDVYGRDAVFPVADTEIGRLAAVASEEILYPEIARTLALRGAEVFLHSSSEIGSPTLTHKQIARRARAIENLAYVISANTAGIADAGIPVACADGNSAVIDWEGRVLAESNSGETMTAFADIDLGAVRAARRKGGMKNYLSRQRLELFAETYAGSVQPADSLMAGGEVGVPTRDHFRRVQEATIGRLADAGII
jgi:predicted amidohydrolase